MWRLFNKLFGWHYVMIRDCSDEHICRVRMSLNGDLMGSFVSRSFFITEDGEISGGYNISEWLPLTFKIKTKLVTK